MNITKVIWLLDRPVSNSGRLKKLITSFAETDSLNWDVQLVPDPDAVLIRSGHIIATSDSNILDGCKHWLNLAHLIINAIHLEYDVNLLGFIRDS